MSFGEELDGEPLWLEQLLVPESGIINTEVETCFISFEVAGEARSSLVIPITQLDGKLLVAIPFAGWHKKLAKRFFPSSGLQKPVSVEVAATPEVGGVVKLWVGFLAPGLMDNTVVGEPEESGVLDFSHGDVPKSLLLESILLSYRLAPKGVEAQRQKKRRCDLLGPESRPKGNCILECVS